MGRHAVLGNGQMLTLFDRSGILRDLYYPYAGYENHVVNLKHRIGISINGNLYWLEEIKNNLDQSAETFKITDSWSFPDYSLNLKSESLIYNEKNILIRKFTVESNSSQTLEIKFFFNQEFKIKENPFRNTGYYYPEKNVVIHYKGDRAFLVRINSESGGMDDYTIGMYQYEGKQGSYKDAENSNLSKCAVEHGPVDSVIAKTLKLNPGQAQVLYYSLIAEQSVEEAIQTNHLLTQKPPEYIFETTSNYWKAWRNQRCMHFADLSTKAVSIFYKSLYVIRSHTDVNTGGILASGDTSYYENGKDFYSYVWARDAYFPAKSMLMLGYSSTAKNLLRFFDRSLNIRGYMPHKFQQDGSLGSSWHPWVKDGVMELPIQEDETAAVVHLLHDYLKTTKDLEFVENYFNNLVESTSNFMSTFINKKMGLPEPSYDLWEAKYLVTTYTTCSVIGALRKAAEIASILGKTKLVERYNKSADLLTAGLKEHLYNKEVGYFVNGIYTDDSGNYKYTDYALDASTLFGLWYYDVISPTDKMFISTLEKVNEKLRYGNGFYIRFENDAYFRENGNPPNVWFNTSSWEVLRYIKYATSKSQLKKVPELVDNLLQISLETGLLPEQYNLNKSEHAGYSPLIWSHAAYLEIVATYMKRCEEFGISEICLPN